MLDKSVEMIDDAVKMWKENPKKLTKSKLFVEWKTS